ncbi:MAG: hypothetical protein ABIS36_17120 [Chryseolinea sp.]
MRIETLVARKKASGKYALWAGIFLLLMMACVYSSFAQNDVTATIRILPPYSTHLSDYADQPEKTLIMLRNNTQRTLQIQLLGSITGENGLELRTAPQFKSPQPIELGPLAVVNLNADAIRNLFDVNKLALSGVSRETLVRGNGLPEGIYTVCIRALDYQTNELLSLEEPLGCSNPMNITNLEPPYLIKPICGEDTVRNLGPQNLLYTWSLPAGAPPSTEYILKVVEMIDPRKNPNDAFLSSTTPAFFEESVMGNAYLFGPAQPTMIPGRRYAYAITARDPFNKVVFRNEGRSEVCAFVYQAPTPIMAISGTLPFPPGFTPSGELDCSCKASTPTGGVNNEKAVVGAKVKVGQFLMTILSVTATGNKLNGEGKIPLPLVNSNAIPVLVQFTDMQVNSNNEMRAGTVKGKLKSDVDFLPSVPGPNLNTIPLNSNDTDKLDNYFERNVDQLVSNFKSAAENAGFELPLGIDKSVGGIGTVIAITGMTFTPTQAGFDAATVVDLPDAGMKVAFAARNICMDAASICGQGTLYLANDLNLGSTGLRLKAAAASFSSPTDSGSYVVFDKVGFKRMRIRADYDLPTGLFSKKIDPGPPVVASLVADAISWSDWMAGVTIEPFTIAGNTDFSFSLAPGKLAMYDHSSTRNPPGMPSIPGKTNSSTMDWNGFFMPEMLVDLPSIIRSISNAPITASATNFIIDRMGISGTLNANHLLEIGNGSLDGWYYSLDNINVKFVNNSFVSGGLQGRVLLPVSTNESGEEKSQLDYTCTLSKPSGSLKFEFVMKPKNDISAPLWIARLNILATSNIHVTEGDGKDFEAVATLNGSLDIGTTIKSLGVINIKAMEFEELVVQTREPYITVKTFRAGLASPQKEVAGFPASLKDPELIIKGNQAGLRIDLDLELADVLDLPAIPTANLTIDIVGDIAFDGRRPIWGGNTAASYSRVRVKGAAGPISLDGYLQFFDGDEVYGNGIRGGIKGEVIGAGLDFDAMFARKSFAYWFVDARQKMPPPGIPIAPPLPLSLFGWGGGVFYNMKQKPLPTAQELFDDKFTTSDLYEPSAGNVGFKATIILGMSDGKLFQANGTLTTIIDVHNMAVRSIQIDANMAQLADLMHTKDAAIKGIGIIRYDFAEEVFEALVGMEVDVKDGSTGLSVMKGSSALGLHVGKRSKQWYLKIGEPDHPNSFPMYGFASFDSYFMAGTADLLPEMPSPPQEVVKQTGYMPSRPYYSDGQMRGLKVAFGASMQFTDKGPANFTFLIFYASIGAGIGFDLTLQQFETGCDGTAGNVPGINGWYANGQLWAWLHGAAGVDVDVDFLPRAKVEAFKVQAAALLRAGLPNPLWFEGWFGGGYSVLGGLVKGQMNFKVAFNEEKKCYPQSNPFSGDPLISQINPNGADVSVMANPQVAFNYPVEKDLDFELVEPDGNVKTHRFKLSIQQLDLVNVKTGKTDFTNGKDGRIVISEDNYKATLFTTQALEAQTDYRVVVNIRVTEWSEAGSYYADYIFPKGSGKRVEQIDANTTFKTGDCVKNLKEPHVLLASYPFDKQRYLLQEEERNGKIILEKGIPCLFGDNVYEVKARFTSYGATQTTQDVAVTMSAGGSQLNFHLPVLPKDAITQIQIIQFRKPAPANSGATPSMTSSLNTRNLYASSAYSGMSEYQGKVNTATTVRTSLVGLSLTQKPTLEEFEIYHYFFKTSKFNSLADKLAASNDEVTATRTSKIGNLEGFNAEYAAAEGFDVFDVHGGTYRNGAGNSYAIRPLIFLREDDRWLQRYANDQLYHAYFMALFGGYPSITLGNVRDQLGNYGGFPPMGPVELAPWSGEPALSQLEINGVSKTSQLATPAAHVFSNP